MTATPAQIAAVGFAALAIGKSFEALEQAGVTLSADQHNQLSAAVGQWLRQRFGDEAVNSAKQALDEQHTSDDADEEEIAAAVEATGSSLATIFARLDNAPSEAFEQASEALQAALTDAYGAASIAAVWGNANTATAGEDAEGNND